MTSERPNVSPAGRYTVSKAAKALGVSRQTIYNYVQQGVFKARELHYSTVGHKGVKIDGMALNRVWAGELGIR